MSVSRCLLAVAVLLSASLPATAIAHDDHPGRYTPSPESSSRNMKLLSTIDKTNVSETYRNSDLAFWGQTVYAGNYDGFRVLDVSDPETPQLLADVDCPGAQHDVSVWQHLVFLSVDAPRTGPGCDSTAITSGAPGWEGIRIFDVMDPRAPVMVGSVATDCGSHTHTLLPDPENGRVLLYVSSYPASALGNSPHGNRCHRATLDGGQGHSKISVVEVPLALPFAARVVSEPRFDLADHDGIAGLRGCHDVTVFVELRLATAACLSEAQLWDISDPVNPRTLTRIDNPAVEFWHSASFTWDGRLVIFGDEAGGGSEPRCRASDPTTTGALWFYDVAGLAAGHTTPVGHWKTPRVQGDAANCTTHNYNVVPVLGRYVLVAASYAAGTSVVDFTDPSASREIAHMDGHGANTWSSYWYDGFVYANDSGRGVDVMLLSDQARAGARKLGRLNPQTQEELLR